MVPFYEWDWRSKPEQLQWLLKKLKKPKETEAAGGEP